MTVLERGGRPTPIDGPISELASLVKRDDRQILIPPNHQQVASALDSFTHALKRENSGFLRYFYPYQPKREQLKTIRDAINHVVWGISKTTTTPVDFLSGDDNRVGASLRNFMQTTDDSEEYGLQNAVLPLFYFMLRHTKEPKKSANLLETIQLLSPENAILVLDDHSQNPDLDRRVDGDFPALRRSSQILDMLSESFTRHPRETDSLHVDNHSPFVFDRALSRISGIYISNEAYEIDFAASWTTVVANLLKTHPRVTALPLTYDNFLVDTAKHLIKTRSENTFQTVVKDIIPRLPPANAIYVLRHYLSVNQAEPQVLLAGKQAGDADKFSATQAAVHYMQAFDALYASFGNRYPGKRSVKLTQKEIDELSWFSRTVNTSILIMTSHEPSFKYRDQMRAGVAAKYRDFEKQYPYLTPYLQLK